jgi:hypothetical protein
MKSLQLVSFALALTLALAPVPLLAHDGPDGTISHKHNEVRAQPTPSEPWHDASLGETLYKAGRVSTAGDSMAAVRLRDDSTVAMRQNTLLIVYGHHATHRAEVIAMEAELERGTLRARLGELEGGRAAHIASPSATSELAGGNTLIKVDDQGTARVANHGEGNTAVVAKRGGKTKLDKGMGVKVEVGKRAAKPIVLPPTPTWLAGPRVFLSVPGQRSEVRGRWATLEQAQGGYFVELARDDAGTDVLAAIEVPSSADSFEVHGLPAGRYHVRVAAIDGDQFESIPSDASALELLDVALAGPGGAGVEWPSDSASPVPRVLPGTTLELPSGVRCGETLEQLVEAPVYRTPGPTTLVCRTDDGREVEAFPVEVVALAPALTDAEAFRVVRGEQVVREIAIDSALPLPEQIYVADTPGFAVESIESLGEGRYRITLQVAADAPPAATLQLGLEAPREGEPFAAFGSLALEVVDPIVTEDIPLLPDYVQHQVELGLSLGLFMPASNHALYRLPDAEHQAMRSTGQLLARVGYYPLRYFGIEAAARVMPTQVVDDRRATAWALRGVLVGQLDTRVGPYVVGGVEALGVASPAQVLGRDTDLGFVLGGGLKAYLRPRLLLRIGLTAGIHERVGAGVTAHADAELGLTVLLGPRSRGRELPTKRAR